MSKRLPWKRSAPTVLHSHNIGKIERTIKNVLSRLRSIHALFQHGYQLYCTPDKHCFCTGISVNTTFSSWLSSHFDVDLFTLLKIVVPSVSRQKFRTFLLVTKTRRLSEWLFPTQLSLYYHPYNMTWTQHYCVTSPLHLPLEQGNRNGIYTHGNKNKWYENEKLWWHTLQCTYSQLHHIKDAISDQPYGRLLETESSLPKQMHSTV